MTPCREYMGCRTHNGYGLRSKTHWTGESLVHRQVWVMVNGPIPEGLIVMHACDNRACYRLDHLSLGTVADNQRDMAEKGRSKKGKVYRPDCPRCGRPKRFMRDRWRCRCGGGG